MSTAQAGVRWPASVPDLLWAPCAAGMLMMLAGILGLATGQLWLFPSLGPTAFLQVETPNQPAAGFYNTVVGHGIGLAAGLAAIWVFQAGSAPAVFAVHHLVEVRVWVSVLAMVLTMFFLALAKASHPPAAATTLLVALGGFRATIHDTLAVIAGVLLVATAGEALRRVRCGEWPRRHAHAR